MAMKIFWGDCLEKLAEAMFTATQPRTDPFETECTVVGSPVMAGWLKQYFLYDLPKDKKQNRVLAGWDFKMLHPFVNDWLAKACAGTPVGQRDPAQHPYSIDVLQWRIWNELAIPEPPKEYGPLLAYVGEDENAMDRKRWELAARVARLFDDYQNYRYDLLQAWQNGKMTGLNDALSWQAVMWKRLVDVNPGTYVQQFKDMPEKLASCGIEQAYRRITVFHISAMPRAYMEFFVELGKLLDVQMYLFNPSKEFWLEDKNVRNHLKALAKNDASLDWLTPPHPILSGFGRGTQAFLATVLDVTEGQIGDDRWSDDKSGSLLHKIQADIRKKGESVIKEAGNDRSIQFHVCHGPQREVEVARDLIFKWFEEHPRAQPREVQVLVPDMDTYAPFIESVFQVNDHNPPIPCSISKRPAVSAGAVGAAFVRLMRFNASRMTAPETLELLELDPVRARYGLEPEDLSEVRGLVNAAGIRWGRDGAHLQNVLDTRDLPDTVTWRRGLDRLLAGFAVGRCAEGDEVIAAGALGLLRLHDGVEGNAADLLGKLGQYFEDLCWTADAISESKCRKVSEWAKFFADMLERFFRATESSFIELAEIRRGIAAVSRAAGLAGDPAPAVTVEVMAAAIEAHLGGMAPAGRSDINAVLFSPMRTMQVTPRKLIIMLGLNEDGVFPRADQRPAFDLLALQPRYGDRSLRREDRLAFLEGLMSARERLIITYTGRNIANNKEIPPSPAVTEFRQYLDSFSGEEGSGGRKLPLVPPVEHKLHGFNPEYYRKDSELFSYSRSNYEAARVLAGLPPTTDDGNAKAPPAATGGEPATDAGTDAGKKTITLKELQEFFANPAKHFYIEVLQVKLPDPAWDTVSDSEMFDEDTLDEYDLNKRILADLLDRTQPDPKAEDDYCLRLQEQALIPLGTYGLGRTRQRYSALRNFLNGRHGYADYERFFLALQALRQKEKEPTPVTVESKGYIVTGSLPIIQHKSCTFLLRFRYASIKPQDRVRAWVAHVAGHAAGNEFYTDIVGKDANKKGEKGGETIAPLSQESAKEILAKMLELYTIGCKKLLPFAPDSSYEYATGVTENGEDSAMEEASKAWSEGRFPESDVPYLSEAWGADGPLVHPEFRIHARAFWEKFVEKLAAEPAANAAAGEGDDHV